MFKSLVSKLGITVQIALALSGLIAARGRVHRITR